MNFVGWSCQRRGRESVIILRIILRGGGRVGVEFWGRVLVVGRVGGGRGVDFWGRGLVIVRGDREGLFSIGV